LNGSNPQCGGSSGPLLDVDPTGKQRLFRIARGAADPPLTMRKFRPCHPLLSFELNLLQQ
jgi:hypothetical protein